jgi:hypothetical protein
MKQIQLIWTREIIHNATRKGEVNYDYIIDLGIDRIKDKDCEFYYDIYHQAEELLRETIET